MRTRATGVAAMALAASTLVAPLRAAPAAAVSLAPAVTTQPPNVLVLVSDDQSWSNFNRTLMPNVFGQLVDKGVLFNRAYDVSSLCCPSRSEIMTGLYEHHTGVDTNQTALIHPTVINALHEMGYKTALAGKYLNSWPCTPRSEFDDWLCEGGGQSSYTLKNPRMNSNGNWTNYTGYTTDILADRLVNFVNSVSPDKPFFAMYSPTSPHLPADDDRCFGLPVPKWRPPSYDEDTTAGAKPQYMRRPPLGPTEKDAIDLDFTRMTQAVSCLDGSIGRIFSGLGSRLDNTLIVYLSDNGFLFGEHRREGKAVPYEEAVRVPFIVRYPAWLPQANAFASDALVENVDIAPTIAEAVGFGWGADGLSLAPLVKKQSTSIRTQALLEGCHGGGMDQCLPYSLQFGRSLAPPFSGVVTSQYKYVRYDTGETELYDLAADPSELTNHAGQQAYATVQADLASRLSALTAPSPVQTTIYSGPSGLLHTRSATFKWFSQSRYATAQCRLDTNGTAGTWTPCILGSVTVGPLAAGNYTFKVAAADENGVTDPTPDSRSFQIQDSGPTVSIDSAPAVQTKSRSVSFSFSSPVPGVSFRCSMAVWGTPVTWSQCVSPASYSNLVDAQWSFQVKAVDSGGAETDPPAQKLVKVDNIGPVIQFKRTPAPTTQSTAAHFIFGPLEKLKGDMNCSLDQGAKTKCTKGSFDATGLAAGSHKLVVTATDPLGNRRKSSYPWVIDRTPPTLTVTAPTGSVTSTSATISWTANEPLMDPTTEYLGLGCALDGVPLSPKLCQSPVSLTGLSQGTHTFVLQVVDVALNVSAPAVSTWTITA